MARISSFLYPLWSRCPFCHQGPDLEGLIQTCPCAIQGRVHVSCLIRRYRKRQCETCHTLYWWEPGVRYDQGAIRKRRFMCFAALFSLILVLVFLLGVACWMWFQFEWRWCSSPDPFFTRSLQEIYTGDFPLVFPLSGRTILRSRSQSDFTNQERNRLETQWRQEAQRINCQSMWMWNMLAAVVVSPWLYADVCLCFLSILGFVHLLINAVYLNRWKHVCIGLLSICVCIEFYDNGAMHGRNSLGAIALNLMTMTGIESFFMWGVLIVEKLYKVDMVPILKDSCPVPVSVRTYQQVKQRRQMIQHHVPVTVLAQMIEQYI